MLEDSGGATEVPTGSAGRHSKFHRLYQGTDESLVFKYDV